MGLLLFACVWLTLYLGVPYTMKSWEANGLFLTTPDYFHTVNERPYPMLQLGLDYVSQFFYDKAVGALILALVPTLLFLLVGLVLHRRIVRALMAGAIACGVLHYVLRPAVRERENMAHLELAAEAHRWDDVLKIVTPKVARENRSLMPYALLALAVNNELADKMYTYPVRSTNDFDTQGQPCHEFYFFKMVLYDCMGCPNEAIHCNFQAAAGTPYGTNFGTLRRQVRFCQDAGNQVLADKYREILSHSTLHRGYRPRQTATLPDTLNTEPQSACGEDRSKKSQSACGEIRSKNTSGQIPVISKGLGYNLALFIDMGIRSPQMCNYFLCALLASQNLEAFVQALQRLRPQLSEPLPPLYQEALRTYAEKPTGF